jgi:hypothetical protein
MKRPTSTVGRRFAVSILVLAILFPPPVSGFLIGRHKSITTLALERFPRTATLTNWEREELIGGSGDTDLSEGGWWLPNAP